MNLSKHLVEAVERLSRVRRRLAVLDSAVTAYVEFAAIDSDPTLPGVSEALSEVERETDQVLEDLRASMDAASRTASGLEVFQAELNALREEAERHVAASGLDDVGASILDGPEYDPTCRKCGGVRRDRPSGVRSCPCGYLAPVSRSERFDVPGAKAVRPTRFPCRCLFCGSGLVVDRLDGNWTCNNASCPGPDEPEPPETTEDAVRRDQLKSFDDPATPTGEDQYGEMLP